MSHLLIWAARNQNLKMKSFKIYFILLLLFKHVESFTIRDYYKSERKLNFYPVSSNLAQDVSVSLLCSGLVTGLLTFLTNLARDNVIDTKLCRKLIHTLSAPAFIFVWPLFSSSDMGSKIAAGCVPLLSFIKLFNDGLEIKTTIQNISTVAKDKQITNFNLADAVSRSGNRKEAYGGPMIYIAIVFLSVFLFFRDSPIGVVALTQLAVGDGLADITGRRWGVKKLPFMTNKSYVGTAAFIVGGFIVSCLLLQWLIITGCIIFDLQANLLNILFISIVCAMVELLPVVDDNITVPLSAALLANLLF